MTLKGQGRDANMFGPIVSKTAVDTDKVTMEHLYRKRHEVSVLKHKNWQVNLYYFRAQLFCVRCNYWRSTSIAHERTLSIFLFAAVCEHMTVKLPLSQVTAHTGQHKHHNTADHSPFIVVQRNSWDTFNGDHHFPITENTSSVHDPNGTQHYSVSYVFYCSTTPTVRIGPNWVARWCSAQDVGLVIDRSRVRLPAIA